jgi:transcriptional regulator
MLNGIVGLEIPIRRLEGKWKVSQNRPAADRTGVVAGLRAAGDRERADMADLVDEAARPSPE